AAPCHTRNSNTTNAEKPQTTTTPIRAAVAYRGLYEPPMMEPSRPTQSSRLRITAEPIPWAAMAKAASVSDRPKRVSSPNPRAPPTAAPPGTTWLTARVDRLIRSRVRYGGGGAWMIPRGRVGEG